MIVHCVHEHSYQCSVILACSIMCECALLTWLVYTIIKCSSQDWQGFETRMTTLEASITVFGSVCVYIHTEYVFYFCWCRQYIGLVESFIVFSQCTHFHTNQTVLWCRSTRSCMWWLGRSRSVHRWWRSR